MLRSRILTCALAGMIIVLVAASSSSAGRLSFSEEQFIVVYEPLTFTTRAGTRITCRVTFEGLIINRGVYNKSLNGQFGFITEVRSEECTQTMVWLTERLGWEMRYKLFTGRLPNIGLVETHLFGLRVRWGRIIVCLYQSETLNPQPLDWRREGGGAIAPLTFFGVNLPSPECFGEEMRITGEGTVTGRRTGRPLILSLI